MGRQVITLGALLFFFGAEAHAQILDDVRSVHPSWTLTSVHPAASKPQVAGMDFLPDGRLLIVEQRGPLQNESGMPVKNGRLTLVDNPDAADPEKIVYRTLADSLEEPVGVLYRNGKAYVAEKNALNEYALDEAGTKAVKTRTLAKIPHDSRGTVNFQEYDFGLLYRDGYFYVAGGGAVKSGGASFDTLPNMLDESRVGGVLKIKEDGDEAAGTAGVELLNAGLRACNGIEWGPDSSMWVTDNQGAYRPSSQLINIVPGRNYGYPGKPNAFSAKPVTPPSLWLPQAEIARSPTYPHLVKKGLYAGQFLVGDLSQGGVKRVFVEKVAGEWQGAVFSFTGGLEAGIEKILEGPEGQLYLGGLGRGDALGNWGWEGTKAGLQKLAPKPGAVTFEILSIRSRRNGMELEFTKPVASTAANPGNFTVETASMQPASGYGRGNMINRRAMTIVAVTLSPDKRRVFLQLSGLQAGQVIVVKAAAVRSQAYEAPRCPAGWYTLNAISPTSAFEGANEVRRAAERVPPFDLKVAAGPGAVRIKVTCEGRYDLRVVTLRGRAAAARAGEGPAEFAFDRSAFEPGLHVVEASSGGRICRKTVLF